MVILTPGSAPSASLMVPVMGCCCIVVATVDKAKAGRHKSCKIKIQQSLLFLLKSENFFIILNSLNETFVLLTLALYVVWRRDRGLFFINAWRLCLQTPLLPLPSS